MSEWIAVIPPSGDVRATARQLLDLAAVPEDVQTQRGGQEFLVRAYVAELYQKATAPRRRRTKKEGDT